MCSLEIHSLPCAFFKILEGVKMIGDIKEKNHRKTPIYSSTRSIIKN